MLGIEGAKERRIALALGALLVITGAWLMYESRGTTLWFDEWLFALEYDDNSLGDIIEPTNGHPTLVPVLVYRLLFATVGIDGSAAYRAVGVGGHLLVVAVLFVYTLRRAGAAVALVAAVLILFLGPGWQNIVWGLQIGWLVSIAGGLGALLALDRRDRAGDIAACALVFLTIAASGPGIAIAAGLIVEVVRTRGWRGAWIALAPFGLFALWWLAYQDSGAVRRTVTLAPGFAADSAAATLSALAGLSGPLLGEETASPGWGRPLALAAAALVVWRLWGMERVPTRVWTLLAVLGAFWFLTGVQRAGIGPAESSRYVYVGAVFAVALAVELVRGVAIPRRAWIVIAAAVAVITVANIGDMRSGAAFLRDQGLLTRTGLTAVEIARPVLDPGQELGAIPGYPLVVVRAGQYFDIERDLGTPAATVDELAGAAENVRLRADEELTAMHGVTLLPSEPARAGAAPMVDAVAAGEVGERDGCVEFTPAAAGPAEPRPALDLTIPTGGLVITGEATVAVRRFADGFPDDPIGRISRGGSGLLAIRADGAPQPWHARVAPAGRVTACGA
ncbi:MAG TPA: hypothetical protein VNO82_23970 [Solirubrobacteraceae bacterium]|nr:hypothetical protein [Solirubrobacteraceae bacterium]